MKLLDQTGYRIDDYTRVAVAEISGATRALVPFAELDAALAAVDGSLGVEIPNTAKVDALVPHFARLTLIGVAFPSFSDGRGFSLGRRLRNAGFTGTLRATGPLIADQFSYALACGFDQIELPVTSASRQPVEQWQRAARVITLGYQRGVNRDGSILDQRRAARKAASHG